jgi:hypothetical protein
MYVNEIAKLQAAGGLVLERWNELTARADASAHESPDAMAKAEFERLWQSNPNALAERVRVENVRRIAAAERAARAGG